MQLGEGLGQFGAGDLFVVDVERLEDGLVDQPADRVVGSPVEVLEVFADDLQGEIESVGDVLVAGVEPLDQCLCGLALAPQPLLLVIKELATDAVFVVHVQQLSFLLFDFLKDALAALDLLAGGCQTLPEVLGEYAAHLLALGRTENDGGVVALDRCFDKIHGEVTLRTLSQLVVRADEVFVDAAVAFVSGVGQSAAADAAADRALECVLVSAVALAGVPVRD